MRRIVDLHTRPSRSSLGARGRGFTLIEMLVALAIMFGMAAIGTLMYVTWIPKIRLNSMTTELSVLMQKSRLEAIQKNREVTVRVETGQTGDRFFRALFSNRADKFTGKDAGFSAQLPIPEEAGIRLVQNSFAGGQVVFEANGTVEGTGHFLFVIYEDVGNTNPRYTSRVEISSIDGRVEVTPPEKRPIGTALP